MERHNNDSALFSPVKMWREGAVALFSKEAVVAKTQEMYYSLLQAPKE